MSRHRQPDKPTPKPLPVIPPVVVPVTRRYFGYFWDDATQTAETSDHVNIMQAANACGGIWYDTPEKRAAMNAQVAREMLAARDAGIANAMLVVSGCGFETRNGNAAVYVGDTEARNRLYGMHAAIGELDLFGMVAAVYTLDEPSSDADVVEADLVSFCAQCRWVFGGPLCTTFGNYGRNTRNGGFYRGISAHDWVGLDAYNEGSSFFDRSLPALLANMGTEQKLVLVPSADTSQNAQQPGPWVDYAQRNARVIMVMPFAWSTPRGLRSNPQLATQWRAAGKTLIGK